MKSGLNQKDLRVRRTRKLLWEALLTLLSVSKRPFDTITINEICEQAMVHRTTFYKHFEDKYDLLAYGYELQSIRFNEFDVHERILHPMQCIEQSGHLDLFRTIMQSLVHNNSLESFIRDKGFVQIKQDLQALKHKEQPAQIPIDVMAAFYSSVVSGLGTWWLLNGQSITSSEMDEYITQLMNPAIFLAERD